MAHREVAQPRHRVGQPEAEAEYKARVDRILAAINLEKPDRVPVRLNMGFWPAKSAGMTAYEAMSDAARARRPGKTSTSSSSPTPRSTRSTTRRPAAMFEALDYKLYSWPGHGVSEAASYQYNEKEWMLPEDYDALISDPSDYLLRTYLPRTVGRLRRLRQRSPRSATTSSCPSSSARSLAGVATRWRPAWRR